jgi:hypothetical protein
MGQHYPVPFAPIPTPMRSSGVAVDMAASLNKTGEQIHGETVT